MKTTEGGLIQGLLATIALCWSGFGLLCSLQVVLPAWTSTLWLFTDFAKESSLLVATFAFLGIVLPAVVRFFGAPRGR